MGGGTTDLDPAAARTPAEFVGLLRQLRDRSGLTYRRIDRLARAAGETLPPSTLATMLGRTTLPREELVGALVRACGEPPDSVDRWLAARRRIADAASGPPVVEPAGPEPPGRAAPARRRPPVRVLVLATVLVAMVSVAAVVLVSQLSKPAGPDGIDPPATSRIRAAHSGLCLSERAGRGDGHVFQADCAGAFPTRKVSRSGDRTSGDATYLIRTDHPEFGPGCMGIREGSREAGAPVEDDFCGQEGAGERFHLDPAGAPDGGFRLRLEHSGLCVTVDDPDTEDAELVQLPCDPDHPGQVFLLEPPPSGLLTSPGA